MDEGFMAEVSAKDSPTRKRGSLRGLAARGQLSLSGGNGQDCEELKPKAEEKIDFSWIRKTEGHQASNESGVLRPNEYRCMRCGRSSKYMKKPGKCKGPKFIV